MKSNFMKKKFGLIMWTDDNFLARKPSELDELFLRWEKEIKVPYWINTCIETVNDHNLSQLKSSGCVGIGIGLKLEVIGFDNIYF